MLCSISGHVPREAVVSRKSGHVFEKSLVTKIIKEIGLCPVTNVPLTLEDLIDVAPPASTLPSVKPEGTSVPALLAALQTAYDASALETYSLRKTLQETREELSQSLYQLDAATRVVARVVRERDAYRRLAEAGGDVGGARGGGDVDSERGGGDVKEAPAKKKAKISSLPEQVAEDLQDTSKALMATRKKREIPATVATPTEVRGFSLQATHTPHDKRKGGGGILALASYPAISGSQHVLTAGADGVAHVVDIPSGDTLATLRDGGHTKKITSIASLGLAKKCLTASSVDGTVRLWDVENASCLSTISQSGVMSISVHPSGGFSKYLYTSSPDAWSMYDIASGDSLVHVQHDGSSDAPYTAASLHPDGLVYAIGGQRGTVTLWESRSQSVAGSVSADGDHAITSIAFSENGYHMASADVDGVKIWDLRKLSCIHQLSVAGAASVAYDQSGLFLGVGAATAAAIYGVKQKYETLATFDGLPKKGAHAVVFGGDAKSLVVGANDLRVYR